MVEYEVLCAAAIAVAAVVVTAASTANVAMQ